MLARAIKLIASKTGVVFTLIFLCFLQSIQAEQVVYRVKSDFDTQQNEVHHFLKKLKVEEVGTYSRTQFLYPLRHDLDQVFSPQSIKTLAQIYQVFAKPNYNNVILLGEAGVGKTYQIDQLVALLSFGIVPDFLAPEIGYENEFLKVIHKSFLGEVDVYLINQSFLTLYSADEKDPFPSETVRIQKLLSDLFEAARREFQRKNSSGKRIGRRSLFIFDEVATLHTAVQDALKKALDGTGFKDATDPIQAKLDRGYMVMANTTPGEFRQLVRGDSAIERRYQIVYLPEPSAEEAIKLMIDRADALKKQFNVPVEVDLDALEYLVHMKKFLNSPPLALPASGLGALEGLFLWSLKKKKEKITLVDAQKYVSQKIGLTETWFPTTDGKPPFHDLEARVKKYVVGHDDVVHRICEVLKSWARFNFGGPVPVFFLGGPSTSGKNTIVKALNMALFGHEGSEMVFSISGVKGFGVEALIEGPPIGNHSDSEPPLIVKRMEGGDRKPSILAFDEGADAAPEELEKFKVFVETGEIRPRGRDARARPLLYPIFILGQWGEDLFTPEMTEEQIAEKNKKLDQKDIEKLFTVSKKSEQRGAVPEALLQRAKRTGGVFMLHPTPKTNYPDIVRTKLVEEIEFQKNMNNIELRVADSLIGAVAKYAIDSKEGPRGLSSILKDFVIGAMSRASEKGLPLRETTVGIHYDNMTNEIILTQFDKSGHNINRWFFSVRELVRSKAAGDCTILNEI